MLIAQRPTVETITTEKNYRQQFAVGPLEPGFGHTLGNSLRRILLSSLGGAAITSVKFEGISHEFSTIPGVEEDVIDIILNLKDVVVKSHVEDTVNVSVELKAEGKGEKTFTAGDLNINSDIEIMNPEYPIATLAGGSSLAAEFTIDTGYGYKPANATPQSSIGQVSIDAIFSPIRRVSMVVEPMQVEESTEYDRLILDIQTDGTVTPKDALASAAATLKTLSEIIEGFGENPRGLDFVEVEEEVPREFARSILELELSERAQHCLERAEIHTVGELLTRTDKELLSITNFGQKSLDEVVEKLDQIGLALASEADEKDEATEKDEPAAPDAAKTEEKAEVV